MEAARGSSFFQPGVPGSLKPFCSLQICLEAFVVSPKPLGWRYFTHGTGEVDGRTGIVNGQPVIERNPLEVSCLQQCSFAHDEKKCILLSRSFCRACLRDHGVIQGFCEEQLVRVCPICFGGRFCLRCAEPQNHRCVCGLVSLGPEGTKALSPACNRVVASWDLSTFR